MQTNDLRLIELLEIELFDHFTVCKQMTDIYLNCQGYTAAILQTIWLWANQWIMFNGMISVK